MSNVLIIKVKEKGSKQEHVYKNKVSLENPALIALILEDLQDMFNAPIKNACLRFLNKKNFPFSP